jgi:hypothetical protein
MPLGTLPISTLFYEGVYILHDLGEKGMRRG